MYVCVRASCVYVFFYTCVCVCMCVCAYVCKHVFESVHARAPCPRTPKPNPIPPSSISLPPCCTCTFYFFLNEKKKTSVVHREVEAIRARRELIPVGDASRRGVGGGFDGAGQVRSDALLMMCANSEDVMAYIARVRVCVCEKGCVRECT